MLAYCLIKSSYMCKIITLKSLLWELRKQYTNNVPKRQERERHLTQCSEPLCRSTLGQLHSDCVNTFAGIICNGFESTGTLPSYCTTNQKKIMFSVQSVYFVRTPLPTRMAKQIVFAFNSVSLNCQHYKRKVNQLRAPRRAEL